MKDKKELEMIVLEKLLENGDKGVSFMDFPNEVGMTDEILQRVIEGLRSGGLGMELPVTQVKAH